MHAKQGRGAIEEWQWVSKESDSPLDEFAWVDSCLGLKIVDILRVVGEELSLLLKQGDEGMRGREALCLNHNIPRHREEDARVLLKESDVKYFLGVVEAKVL